MNRTCAETVKNSWETLCQHNSADNLQQIVFHRDSTESCGGSSCALLDQGSGMMVENKQIYEGTISTKTNSEYKTVFK